jgi:Ca2+-binding RTX toxin-like protein
MSHSIHIETLEQRRHLSVAIKDGVLTIIGTRHHDTIEVYVSGPQHHRELIIDDDRKAFSFDPAQVKKVRIDTGQGDDNVFYSFFPPRNSETLIPIPLRSVSFDAPATIHGGDGNDTLIGNAGADSLDGADGNDLLQGAEGNDTLDGGAGQDQILGQDGNDVIRGGDGNDHLSGGMGNDTLQGDVGHDDLSGDQGDDVLEGGPSGDHLDGGDGLDRVFGNRGNDIFLSTDPGRQRRDLEPGEGIFDPPQPLSAIAF